MPPASGPSSSGLLDFEPGPSGAVLSTTPTGSVPLPLLDFLRDVGKHFTVNAMLAKESVQGPLRRGRVGISFTEFSYMLLQAYDFLHLFDTEGCRLQVGGSDQWGNITAGIDLIRRVRGAEAYGLTWPLITKADGTKFGKSEAGNVWLDPARTSPYEFFQFWMNTDDRDVGRYLRTFTSLDEAEIAGSRRRGGRAPASGTPTAVLAHEVTALIHGEAAAAAAAAGGGGACSAATCASSTRPPWHQVFADAPSSELAPARLEAGVPLVDLLAESGLVASKSAARQATQPRAGCR